MQRRDIDLVRLVGEPRTCAVRESSDKNGAFEILSPGIGFYDLPPATGTFLRPGSFVGYLTVMRRYYHLLVPEGRHGVVTDVHASNRRQRVEYGQPLLTVSPRAEAAIATEFDASAAGTATSAEDVPEGMFGVRSPTDGILYRRANPQSPPYVEEGARVSHGTVLALVEVMKCFNPIVYPGEPEFPPEARVIRVVPDDAAEVKHGAVIVIVEPL